MIPGIERDARQGKQPSPALDPGVILVIDESLPIRTKLTEILHKLGTSSGRIVQATSESEAIAAFREHRPRVVFTELVGVHPEDGLEIIHAMLEIDPNTRVVLV
ncbi:MAG TPA: hypothetical protein VFH78_03965, partial [Candidatus Thermoplasmatota archaeon]|nr:hypothetical protein [Candidatus Thermoplasmatota archaeon]